jgi:hypothetical protein
MAGARSRLPAALAVLAIVVAAFHRDVGDDAGARPDARLPRALPRYASRRVAGALAVVFANAAL